MHTWTCELRRADDTDSSESKNRHQEKLYIKNKKFKCASQNHSKSEAIMIGKESYFENNTQILKCLPHKSGTIQWKR